LDFGSHVFLKKHLNDYEDDHPLLVIFDLNPKYMDYVESLFCELDGVPSFPNRITQMKDISNWESTFSELEFARNLKTNNLEFVKTEKNAPTPDIKASILGTDLFFEIKLLLENDEARRVYHEIWKTESDLVVTINYGVLDKEKADRLIEFIQAKIAAEEIGSFSSEETEIKIEKKKSIRNKRTSLITFFGHVMIPLEPIRKKVFRDFYDKLSQFESCNPIFWVIDCQRWKYSIDDFKTIVYGETITDLTVGLRIYGLSDITERAARNLELFNGTGLIPTLTYPKKNGLFFLKEAKCLNGVIAKTHGHTHLLLNPFAEKQLDINLVRESNAVLSN
jgi:hypothetical protein